jgi:hypothetical protein
VFDMSPVDFDSCAHTNESANTSAAKIRIRFLMKIS